MSDTAKGGVESPAVAGDRRLDELSAKLARALAPDLEVLRLIGSGTAAHVFLAREPALRRLVAIKVLRPELAESGESLAARFEREARVAAGVSHPSVPAVHRVGRLDDGVPFMVQQYVDGRTLRSRLEATGALPPAEARRVLKDLAGALAAAHAAGVIHRDVRPENVLLESETQRAVLMDFGLAALRETGGTQVTQITRAGEVIGDPHYASPEQLRGEEVSAETDIYSLGVLGYEILTLTNPFGSKTAHELLTGHLKREPESLPWKAGASDPVLADMLRRCLAKEPQNRPWAKDITKALSEETSSREVQGTPGGKGQTRAVAGHGSHATASAFPRLAAFMDELKRRRVYQLAVWYVGFVGLVIAGQDFITGAMGLSMETYRIGVVVALAGFPVALVLGWVFDVTSQGIERTADVAPGRTRGLMILGLVASVALVFAIGWWVLR